MIKKSLMTTNVNITGGQITGMSSPTNASDVAIKSYVDAVASGLTNFKTPVRVVTNAALPAYSRTGNVITASANGALAAIDGITIGGSDRLLLKDGAAGSDNGIYVVTQVGDAGNPFVLTRSTDADIDSEVTGGLYVFVNEGTVFADSSFVLSTNNPITLNTTALTFVQFSGAGQIVAGSALTKTGNTLDVAVDNATVEVNADALRVKASGITANELATGAVAAGKINVGGISNANQFAAGVIDTAAIGNTQVTAAKIDLSGAFPFTGKVTASGGFAVKRRAINDADVSDMAVADSYFGYTAISAARVVNLIAAATAGDGFIVIVKDESGSCSATNTITIDANVSEQIDGANTLVLNTAREWAVLLCAAGAWVQIG